LIIELGSSYCDALNHLCKVHVAAFYLKVATSTQIKVAFSAGVRLPWSTIEKSINILKADIRHEQTFMTEVAFDKRILNAIDSTTSIVMSSKLAYQLSQLLDWHFSRIHFV
jgi:hypothetical protein